MLFYAVRGHSETGRTNTEIPYSGISVSVYYRYRTRFFTSSGIAYRYRISGIFGSVRYRYPSLVVVRPWKAGNHPKSPPSSLTLRTKARQSRDLLTPVTENKRNPKHAQNHIRNRLDIRVGIVIDFISVMKPKLFCFLCAGSRFTWFQHRDRA